MADVENMVLRTIYLPLEVDRELKSIAFSRDVSKAELMRGFILQGLARFRESGEATLAQRVSVRAHAVAAASSAHSRGAATSAGAEVAPVEVAEDRIAGGGKKPARLLRGRERARVGAAAG